MAQGKKTVVSYGESIVPDWIREVIETSFAIEAEDARNSGNLGFMTRALVSATLPYKDPKSKSFERKNGDLTLSMLSPKGVPFGRYPRLLISWLVTEAVRTQSPTLVLGDSLTQFLRDTVGVRSTGGREGSQTRITEQMERLFTSLVSVERRSQAKSADFELENILLVQRGRLTEDDRRRIDNFDALDNAADHPGLWVQPGGADAGKWNSHVELTREFYRECIESPVPLDMRAYRVLSPAPMAMDIYAWLTYRASYIKRATRAIPWEALQAQFGSSHAFTEQGLRDFRKAFKRNLDVVRAVYPNLKVDESTDAKGVILLPMLPHVPKIGTGSQSTLF